jgi:hypothetical protein
MEVFMEPRREVEEFRGGEWKDLTDGRIYCVQIKVNGEEKPFNVEVAISNTVRSTQPHGVERELCEQDWEEIAKMKMKKEVRTGCLDGWSRILALPLEIDWREVDDLVADAIREGKIAP